MNHIFELLTRLLADLFAGPAAAGAEGLGRGQGMLAAHQRQGLEQFFRKRHPSAA
jgi:16S rRNA G966 N2-methylase RsmD